MCGRAASRMEGIAVMTLFQLFFTTRIPENMRYRSFTLLHFVLLLGVAAGILISAKHIKRADSPRKEKMLLVFTWALPGMYLLRFVVFWLLDSFVEPQMALLDRMPFHLCAMNAIVMPVAVAKKNKTLLNYMYAIALPAAVAAMLTPAMSYYGRYFYFSWQVLFFFLDHGLMVLVAVLAVCGGLLRPDVKELPRVAVLFVAYAAIIYPVNKLLNQNYLFLNYPDQGTVMAFFAKYLGNPGYLVPLALLAAAVVLLMYLPWILIDRKTQPPSGPDEQIDK